MTIGQQIDAALKNAKAPAAQQMAKAQSVAETWTEAAIAAGVAVGSALLLHYLLFAVLDRIAKNSDTEHDNAILSMLRQPIRWTMVALAISLATENNALIAQIWTLTGRFVMPAMFGWVALASVQILSYYLEERADQTADPTAARSRRTRLTILSRSARMLVIFVTVSLILLGIPAVRSVGVTLMASAGIAGIAVGAAAQPALKSFIAGLQMALTQPIRIDDMVVVDGVRGRVEDIRTTFVIIRTSDERRLIVPTAKFFDSSFQNWSRMGGGITGSVILPLKPDTDIAPIRAEFLRLLDGMPDWDRRDGRLIVAEARVGSIDVQLLMSSSGSTTAIRLQSQMREAMLDWLRVNMPDALCN